MIYANRFCLDTNLRKMMCECLVLSHFNYRDVVYKNFLTQADMTGIQNVQNECVWCIFDLCKYDHVPHKLKELQWLNI